jgi:CRISPR-associated endonuclease Cas1
MPAPSVTTRTYLFSTLDPTAWAQAEQNNDPAVLICDGIQTYIQVRNGHLQVTDGPPDSRRTRKLARVPHKVSRIMVLGNAGYTTFEAQRWMRDAGIAYTHIDRDAQIVDMSGPRREDARLLRAQAFATENGPLEPAGIKITQSLISAKLEGQARNLDEFFRAGNESGKLRNLSEWVHKAETLPECRTLEAQGAALYWQTWAGRVHVPFPATDLAKVPGHWLMFTGRTSMGYGYEQNKNATDPVNAMLNYAYRVGETEAIHACHATGLHPALGILHTDKQGRNSMALDLLEALRPAIDRVILGMLSTELKVPYGPDGKLTHLDRRTFCETKNGTVRLVPPITHVIAGYAAGWGTDIRAHTQAAARTLAMATPGDITVPRARKYVQGGRPMSGKRARLLGQCPRS